MVTKKQQQFIDPILNAEFENIYAGMPKKWVAYEANPVAEAGMTWDTFTQEYTRYSIAGDTVFVQAYILGTTSVVGTARLYIDVPRVPSFNTIDNFLGGACLVRDGATVYVPGIWTWVSSTSQIVVLRGDSANFGLGTERGFMLQFIYEIG
jgi:hypothetical protein